MSHNSYQTTSIPNHSFTPANTPHRGTISGGTGLTILTFMDCHTIPEIAATAKPFSLSPIPGPTSHSSVSLLTRILGIRTHPMLGLLTTAIQAPVDTPIVQRSWGLLGGAKLYGPNFFYEQYMRTTSYARGIALHFAIKIGILLLAIPPVRWFLKKLIYAPGDGPAEEESKTYRVEYRAVAVADVPTPPSAPKPRAYCRAWFEGGMYHCTFILASLRPLFHPILPSRFTRCPNPTSMPLNARSRNTTDPTNPTVTGILLTQAAITLLKDDVVAKKFGGGILTPATLGQPYIDRLNEAGFKFEVRMLED